MTKVRSLDEMRQDRRQSATLRAMLADTADLLEQITKAWLPEQFSSATRATSGNNSLATKTAIGQALLALDEDFEALKLQAEAIRDILGEEVG